ncbi:MAG: hypothetical protein ABR507_02830, partial [Actinomycetota bacterium]
MSRAKSERLFRTGSMVARSCSIIAFALLLLAPITGTAALAASAADGIAQVSLMDSGSSSGRALRMLVDNPTNRGFAVGPITDNSGSYAGDAMLVYDLDGLKVTKVIPKPSGENYFGISGEQATVDEKGHRIFFFPKIPSGSSGTCVAGIPDPKFSIAQFDTKALEWSTIPVPCTHGDVLKIQGLFFDEGSAKLYAVGTLQDEWAPRSIAAAQNQYGETLLLSQLSLAGGQLISDWEIDLRSIGCDRAVSVGFGAFVARYRQSVIAYCYGARSSLDGSQGFAVRVPLQNDRLTSIVGESTADVTPTLPNDLSPLLDPGSGKLLLLTTQESSNGTAVWVYEPDNDRFAGLIASGVSSSDGKTTYFGIDESTGRTYFFNAAGLLVADVRHDPLPSGLNFPILKDLPYQGSGQYIAVASNLNRIFIPIAGKGFAVFEDHVPRPPEITAPDLDAGTADVAEADGQTGHAFGGAAAAFGAHIINTGGIPRIGDNLDPLCYSFAAGILGTKDDQGRCLEDQTIS